MTLRTIALFLSLLTSGLVLGQTPLEQYESLASAIKEGDAVAFDQALGQDFDVNFRPESKGSLLRMAIYAKNHHAVKTLLARNADVSLEEGFYQGTPIMFAADANDIGIVDLLLKHGADINSRDGAFGDSAINWATFAGHFDMVDYLLQKGANPMIVGHGNALDIAMRRGSQNLVELIATRSKATRIPTKAESSLVAAIETSDEKAAAQAIQMGAARGLDRFHRPLIAMASREGQLEILKLLVQAGADVDAPDPIGYTPLMEAARDQQTACVRYLLQNGAKVNHVSRDRGLNLTPLHLGAIGGSVQVVELLMAAGANPNVKGSVGTTPLLWGIFEGNTEAGIKLIQLGADPTLTTSTGYSAADFAKDYEKEELTKAIEQWNAQAKPSPSEHQTLSP